LPVVNKQHNEVVVNRGLPSLLAAGRTCYDVCSATWPPLVKKRSTHSYCPNSATLTYTQHTLSHMTSHMQILITPINVTNI